MLLLLSAAFIPALPLASAQTTTLNIGAVFTHPIQAVTDFNNPYPSFFLYQNAGVMNLFEAYPYTYYGANDTYIPSLVESTTTIASNNTYIVHLRNDSGWSNGQPVTAYDYWASLVMINGLGSPAYVSKVINNYTISIQVPDAPASGLNGLNLGSFIFGPDVGDVPVMWHYSDVKSIVNDIEGNFTAVQAGNSSVIASLTAEIANEKVPMLFSGPYYPVSVTSSEILMHKNPYYFDASKITIPNIVIHQFTTPSSLYQSLVSGQLDLYFGGTTINDDEGAVVPSSYQAAMPAYMEQLSLAGYTGPAIFFNNATVSNLHVREAIAYTLNRTEVAAAGGVSYSALQYPLGLAQYMIGNSSTSICNAACTAQMNPYTLNLTAASAQMTQAGYTLKSGTWTSSNGTQLTLNLLNAQSTDATWLNMALDIQSQLSKFGIQSNILNPTNPTSYALKGSGFDMYMTGFGWFITPWDIYRPAYIYDGLPYAVMHATSNITIPINNAGSTNQVKLFYQLENAKNTTAEIAYDQDLAWLIDHELTYFPIAETNPIMYLNTHDFTWPGANSSIWNAVIGQDPGIAIVLGEETGQLQPASGSSGTSTTTTTTSASITATSVSSTGSTSPSVSTSASSASVTSASVSSPSTTVTSMTTAPTSPTTTTATSTSSSTALLPTTGIAMLAVGVVIAAAAYEMLRRRAKDGPPSPLPVLATG